MGTEIEPYHKRPRMMTIMMVDIEDERRHSQPLNLDQVKRHDFIWMMSLAMNDIKTPM